MGPAPGIYPGQHPALHAQREQVGWQRQAADGTSARSGLWSASSSGGTEQQLSRHNWAATWVSTGWQPVHSMRLQVTGTGEEDATRQGAGPDPAAAWCPGQCELWRGTDISVATPLSACMPPLPRTLGLGRLMQVQHHSCIRALPACWTALGGCPATPSAAGRVAPSAALPQALASTKQRQLGPTWNACAAVAAPCARLHLLPWAQPSGATSPQDRHAPRTQPSGPSSADSVLQRNLDAEASCTRPPTVWAQLVGPAFQNRLLSFVR